MTDQQKTIDMTPSWSAVASMFRLFMKDDTPPEITYELDRLGALADELVRSHKSYAEVSAHRKGVKSNGSIG